MCDTQHTSGPGYAATGGGQRAADQVGFITQHVFFQWNVDRKAGRAW